jgi:hypothetical protein
VALFVFGLCAQGASAEPAQISKVGAFAVTANSASLKAEINPQGKNTQFRFEYGTEDCATSVCSVALSGSIPSGSSPVPKEASLEGLSPATLYHFRVIAKHTAEADVSSGDRTFATRTETFLGLPDGRAYEQASPVDKNGNDVLGDVPTIKATAAGGGITFASTFGVPGGKGAQEFPTYLGSRGAGIWSTQGLLPPPSTGERAQVVGWSPDYTEVFSNVSRLESQKLSALIVQSTRGGEPVEITPYVAKADFFYAGQSQDGSVVLFESKSKLIPEALEGFSNLYAWDRETGNLSLAGVTNHETSPPKGSLAGPYEWSEGITAQSLRLGGAFRGFYLRDENAVSPDGSVYFTEVGTGQLYRRLNPTEPQSPLSGTGKCEDPSLACTIHVSASLKTDGEGPNGTDSAGPQPAAFQAASTDGSETFFTSPEKLTNEANTGPEQPPARIERDDLSGGAIETPDFISPQKAVGLAVDGSHVYWAEPAIGAIGRSDLNGENKDPAFITPGPTECEVEGDPGIFEPVESRPRYVAVDAGNIYWTNTGCSDEIGPTAGSGTIGRANIDGEEASVEPAFIEGASNPQGIAVNTTHIYWANSGRSVGTKAIGRATIAGGEVEQEFVKVAFNDRGPSGVALSPTRLYYSSNEEVADNGYIGSLPLGGGEDNSFFFGKAGIREVAVDGSHLYWATQGEEAIGRADLELENLEPKFTPLEGKPNGLTVDNSHLYWATNGEAPTNPGNDLYRYGPEPGELTDLTPDSDGNGAEVQGVAGVSDDGSYVYFAANGVLDGEEKAKPGDCEGPLGSSSGSCSLYLWHEGTVSFVARMLTGSAGKTDALNWAGTPRNQFATASYFPKTSFASADGRSLLFRSREKLTAYENEGVPELYRFKVGEEVSCVSCSPTGEAAGEGPRLGQLLFPGIGPLASVLAVSSRNFSASGDQAFFETSEGLVPEDTNGQAGCPLSGTGVQFYRACTDVYEWEAAGAGSCKEGSPAYSQLNGGCVYLLSTGKSEFPSLFADASVSGKDVFFFTRQALVGQDRDELQDVYDARVGGGLPSQNPAAATICESVESCHGPAQTPPTESAGGSATFVGPGNPVPKHKKQKAKKHKAKNKKHKGKAKKHTRANANGRTGR